MQRWESLGPEFEKLGVTLLAASPDTVEESAGLQRKIPGVRIYGKTGTAEAVTIRDEEPYGYTPGTTDAKPHSWFLALAEPVDHEACGSNGSGRLAIAVVLPRGGGGATAGAVVVDIIEAAVALGYFGDRV